MGTAELAVTRQADDKSERCLRAADHANGAWSVPPRAQTNPKTSVCRFRLLRMNWNLKVLTASGMRCSELLEEHDELKAKSSRTN
jgi:hypothetical protein